MQKVVKVIAAHIVAEQKNMDAMQNNIQVIGLAGSVVPKIIEVFTTVVAIFAINISVTYAAILSSEFAILVILGLSVFFRTYH